MEANFFQYDLADRLRYECYLTASFPADAFGAPTMWETVYREAQRLRGKYGPFDQFKRRNMLRQSDQF